MHLILDEWLIHDLQNENGDDKQKESFRFLKKIEEKCDKVLLIDDSKFAKKLWKLSKEASKSVELKKKFTFLRGSFIYNSQKVEKVNQEDIKRESYNDILEGVNPDDHYLAQGYEYLKQKGIESKIITTDKNLKARLEGKGMFIELRDDFIRSYEDDYRGTF